MFPRIWFVEFESKGLEIKRVLAFKPKLGALGLTMDGVDRMRRSDDPNGPMHHDGLFGNQRWRLRGAFGGPNVSTHLARSLQIERLMHTGG